MLKNYEDFVAIHDLIRIAVHKCKIAVLLVVPISALFINS